MNWIFSYLGEIAGALTLLAFVPFIIAILQKKAKPSIITWTTLTIMNILLIKSYYDSGARTTLWLPIAFLIGDIVICLLSFKYGEKIITKIDKICIGLIVINILSILLLSYNKDIVLSLSIVTLSIGAFPTIKKSWLRPWGENKTAWSMFATAAILNVIAIQNWSSIAIIAHPIYAFTFDVSVAMILWIKSKKRPA